MCVCVCVCVCECVCVKEKEQEQGQDVQSSDLWSDLQGELFQNVEILERAFGFERIVDSIPGSAQSNIHPINDSTHTHTYTTHAHTHDTRTHANSLLELHEAGPEPRKVNTESESHAMRDRLHLINVAR